MYLFVFEYGVNIVVIVCDCEGGVDCGYVCIVGMYDEVLCCVCDFEIGFVVCECYVLFVILWFDLDMILWCDCYC